jgi:hypothetical protein
MEKEGTAFGNAKSLRDAIYLLSAKNGYAVVGADANLKLTKHS